MPTRSLIWIILSDIHLLGWCSAQVTNNTNPVSASFFSTRYSVMCMVYTGYHGTSEIEHGLCACTVDNPLAKARGLFLCTGAQTMLYLSLNNLYATTFLPGSVRSSVGKALWVKRWPTELAVLGSSHAGGEIFSTVNGIPLHRTFHYCPPIVLIWRKYCWKVRKIARHPSFFPAV